MEPRYRLLIWSPVYEMWRSCPPESWSSVLRRVQLHIQVGQCPRNYLQVQRVL